MTGPDGVCRQVWEGQEFFGYDKLLRGIVPPRPAFIETGNRGAEHIGPEETFDGDYGRLLERVQNHGKRVSSPAGFEPAFWP
jgi:hypothetical protein